MKRYCLLLFIILLSNNFISQTLNPYQEKFVKSTIAKQFGDLSENTLLNLGTAAFCFVGPDTFYTAPGYNYLFLIKGDSIQRIDQSNFHGNNNRRFLFEWHNKIFTLGGYGFFTTNNHLLVFNNEISEWTYAITNGKVPPFIYGHTFKSGQYIYSFNNSKSGNNSQPDQLDKNTYRLNLNNMVWDQLMPKTSSSIYSNNSIYTRDYYFSIGYGKSLIIHPKSMRFIEISNDFFGINNNTNVNSVNGNVIFLKSLNSPEVKNKIIINLDDIWINLYKNSVPLKFDEIKPVKKNFGPLLKLSLWFLCAFILLGFVILIFKIHKIKKELFFSQNLTKDLMKEKSLNENILENESPINLDLINNLINSTKSLLTSDEIDEHLKISHLEGESRKLRRYRLLKAIENERPNLITRIKDSTDRRRFFYKINIIDQKH